METAAIRYRVADFLKKQPPFNVMQEEDLLQLAGHGRVKFFEPNQYILSQGASRHQLHVIQQGAVSLWDEGSKDSRLLDVRGAGDILGIDQFYEIRVYPYSATSASDVLVYSFPVEEFLALVEKYPEAMQYVAAYGNLTARNRTSREHSDPQDVLLRDVVAGKEPGTCGLESTIQDAARSLHASGQDAILVRDPEQRIRGVVTPGVLVEWIAKGNTNIHQTVSTLPLAPPAAIASDASVADGVLRMGASGTDALALTPDGTNSGPAHAMVTLRSLGQVFGDRPLEILRGIGYAQDVRELHHLNHRARQLTLRYLNTAPSTDWLARYTSAIDSAIVKRVIAMAAREHMDRCWCFCGATGRGEALPRLAPGIVLIADDDRPFAAVREQLGECGYLPDSEILFESEFLAASAEEWKGRFGDWMSDPVLKEIYNAYPFLDLRPIFGSDSTWKELETAAMAAVNAEFLHVVANDCLSTLPPLTFFKNAVLDEAGEEMSVFRLEETALRPLVYVGRLFGLAAKRVFNTSTLDRFAMAEGLLPEYASIFREASEALRIVLWQQGRAGISQGTAGSEVPPALLGAYDRQLLKNAFRSILRLLEFTGEMEWLKAQ